MPSTKYSVEVEPHVLRFKEPAGTSRGVYTERQLWLVRVSDVAMPGRVGVGECAPLHDLSCDFSPGYERVLRDFCHRFEAEGEKVLADMRDYPSMLFGLETALLNLRRGSSALYDTPFSRGEEGIPINGLVWMGDHATMLRRLEEKLAAGFRCVKFKIGAIDFEDELHLLREVRREFPADVVEIRVDANGAFSPAEAAARLEALARYDIHSIEQPIRQGQWKNMAEICASSPIPVALDEELIGVNDASAKRLLLEEIHPQYIILKPTLHGGVSGVREWVAMAGGMGIGSWITSALESNIGLNAVAHLAADIYGPNVTMPQGLGTGQLFVENFDMPIQIRGSKLWYAV